jgi:GMP synthase (glutamine-hydrolysing)
MRRAFSARTFLQARTFSSVPPWARIQQTPKKLRILIVDGYEKRSHDEFDAVGLKYASVLYTEMISANSPKNVEIQFDTIFPCHQGYVPLTDDHLSSYDAAAFTGSSLSAYGPEAGVKIQLALMKRTFDCGISSFGSCWGMQIAAMAMGGKVGLNPLGREVGFGRKIALSQAGRQHAMFAGKKSVFEAFESHSDIVCELPPGAVVLVWSMRISF